MTVLGELRDKMENDKKTMLEYAVADKKRLLHPLVENAGEGTHSS
jgi:hypothetical protein